MKQGHQQILWLYGDEHYITEVGTMNIMLFWKNTDGDLELVTPPIEQGVILPGVTRDSLLTLAREWGEFKESFSHRNFLYKGLPSAVKEEFEFSKHMFRDHSAT